MQVKEAKIQVPRGSEPHPRFPSPLSPPPPRRPTGSQGQPKSQRRLIPGGESDGPQSPKWKGRHTHTLQREFCKRVSRANRILAFVRQITKGLRFLFSASGSLPLPLRLYLLRSVCGQEEMAAGETQLYAKVTSKLKGRSSSALLEPLLDMGFPAHTA